MSWDEIVGHEENIKILQDILATDRIPHALLFAGPEGIGKQLVATVFTAGILCQNEAYRPCGTCLSCRSVSQHTHPDVTRIEPEGQNIKIDQMRQLQHQAGLGGVAGTKRICIITEAHLLNEQAGNSLLKLLEEPPADMIFILLTAKPYALLPTIVSRCSMLKFESLPLTALTQALITKGYSENVVQVAARLSGGRMGQALRLLQPEGFHLRDEAFDLLQELFTFNIHDLLAQALKIDAYEGEETLALLRYMLLILRDAIIYQNCRELSLVCNIDIAEKLTTVANQCTADMLYQAITEVQVAQRAVRQRANVRLTMEALLLKLTALVRGEKLADGSRSSL